MGVEFPAINVLVKCVAASQSGSGGGLMSGCCWKPPVSALLVHLFSLALTFITLANSTHAAIFICSGKQMGSLHLYSIDERLFFFLLVIDYLSSERSNVTDVTW